MRSWTWSSVLALICVLSVGCATKNYVRNQTAPTITKVNELDDLTSKNTTAIRDVDSRAQQGIQQLNEQASAADQKALAAGQQADKAQVAASRAVNGVS